MDETDFKIAVIGLGIIGGSMAYALRGFRNARIAGCDTNADTRKKALARGAVDEVFDDARSAVQGADLIIICVYPEIIPKIIEDCKGVFKDGAVVTDVCGVKAELAQKLKEIVPQGIEYVGGHPMAGRETDGFDSASPELFGMCGYIITPIDGLSRARGIKLVREAAHYIGAARITESTPEEHDSVIAYTSDLMHISAAALCLDYNRGMNRAYTAGAFRDCTRIANINPQLWSELFIENRDCLLSEIDRFQASIDRLKKAIEANDRQELCDILTTVRENKLEMQKKEPQKG